jgi:hypothetical protein
VTEMMGVLDDVRALAVLVRFLVGEDARGTLTVDQPPFSGQLFLDHGRLVGASFESETGEPAMHALALAFGNRGRFHFVEGVNEPTLDSTPGPCLLPMLDKFAERGAQLARLIPALTAIPMPIDLEGPEEAPISFQRRDLAVLRACNGHATVGDVVGKCGLVTALERIAHFVELGLVRIEPAAELEVASSELAAQATVQPAPRLPSGRSLGGARPAGPRQTEPAPLGSNGPARPDRRRWQWRRP